MVSVVSAVIVVLAIIITVATLIIITSVFIRIRRKRAALLQHEYEIPQMPEMILDQQRNTIDRRQEHSILNVSNALASTESEPTELDSLYATIGEREANICIIMNANSAYQASTNFSFVKNPAYATNAGGANELRREKL